MTYRARILGHDGQVLVQDMAIEGPVEELAVAIPHRITAWYLRGEIDPTGLVPYTKGIAHYERTDGGGTRIYRLRVRL